MATRLLRPRKPPLDQAGDQGAVAEHALEHHTLIQPGFEIVPQHVLLKQRIKVQTIHRLHGPDTEDIVVTNKAQRRDAQSVQPPGQQHG